MQQIISILLIGISLSMDTFSLSLAIATLYRKKNIYILPFFVGLFHFFMPLIGNAIGISLMKFFNIASNVVLGVILIILGLNLAIHYFKDEEISINFNIIGMLLFAISVSIDSFTVGIGMSNITNNYLLSSLVFAICSFSFTIMGLIIGKYTNKYIGKYAIIIGILLLNIIGIYYLIG